MPETKPEIPEDLILKAMSTEQIEQRINLLEKAREPLFNPAPGENQEQGSARHDQLGTINGERAALMKILRDRKV